MTIEETPEDIIARLTELNNTLAQMLKRGSDNLQESARELMAQGWEVGFNTGKETYREFYTGDGSPMSVPCNPYRQPVNMFGSDAE